MNIELDKITLWEQYKKSDFMQSYFKAFRDFLQKEFVDMFYTQNEIDKHIEVGNFLKDIGINEGNSNYIEYYFKWIYNLFKPEFIQRTFLDTGWNYDNNVHYDDEGEVEEVPIKIFVKLFKFIYNLNYNHFSIPILSNLIADFCEVSSTDVVISKDDIVSSTYVVKISGGNYSVAFKRLYDNYNSLFNLPLGFGLSIILD